jgi:Protein of unknown function (DUF2934)
MTQDTTRKMLMKSGAQPQNLEAKIRQGAYELYEARGREDGHDLEDWLRAESEITPQEQKSRTIAA